MTDGATTDGSAPRYEPIAVGSESTVVAEFVPGPTSEAGYQSEADFERAFIDLLRQEAYEYLSLTSEAGLIANFADPARSAERDHLLRRRVGSVLRLADRG